MVDREVNIPPTQLYIGAGKKEREIRKEKEHGGLHFPRGLRLHRYQSVALKGSQPSQPSQPISPSDLSPFRSPLPIFWHSNPAKSFFPVRDIHIRFDSPHPRHFPNPEIG